MTLQLLRERLHQAVGHAAEPLARGLAATGLRANHVTLAGLAVSVVAAALIVAGMPVAGGLVWLGSGPLDVLDGIMARVQRHTNAFGAFLDSTVDRISEGVLLSAIAYQFASQGEALNAAATTYALLASLLVSYARARAEARLANLADPPGPAWQGLDLGARLEANAVQPRRERCLLDLARSAVDLEDPSTVPGHQMGRGALGWHRPRRGGGRCRRRQL